MHRCTPSNASRFKPSKCAPSEVLDAVRAAASRPLTTDAFIRGNYSIRADGIFSCTMSSDAVRLHRWDEIALEKVTEMVSRKIVVGEREMMAQVYLKRGCLVP